MVNLPTAYLIKRSGCKYLTVLFIKDLKLSGTFQKRFFPVISNFFV